MDKIEIAKKIRKKGGTLYLVGGAVRDELLGREVQDEDYCVTGLSEEKFEELFPMAYKRGTSFPVYVLETKEIALARREQKSGIGHKEFSVVTGKEITIEEDLARRDITINAIAKNVLTQEWIDPYQGRKDLKNKIIRATTSAFLEDPLRAYRVARFASILEFEVEQNTLSMMQKLKPELSSLAKERVFEECKKALASKKPSIFFRVLKSAGILEVHFKEIQDLIGSLQPIKYHPEGDSFEHTMMVVDKSAEITEDLRIRFSCLVHDLGKGITPKEMLPHHYGHDKKGEELVEHLGQRIAIPKAWIECGKVAAKEHMLGGIFEQMSIPKQVDFLTRVAKSRLGLDGMQIVVFCDRWRKEEKPENILFAQIGKECLKEINGEYIKQKYSIEDTKQVGELLRKERIEWMKKKKQNT